MVLKELWYRLGLTEKTEEYITDIVKEQGAVISTTYEDFNPYDYAQIQPFTFLDEKIIKFSVNNIYFIPHYDEHYNTFKKGDKVEITYGRVYNATFDKGELVDLILTGNFHFIDAKKIE